MSLATLTWEQLYPARNDERPADLTRILRLPKVKRLLAKVKPKRNRG